MAAAGVVHKPGIAQEVLRDLAPLAAELGLVRPPVGLELDGLRALYTRFVANAPASAAAVVTDRIDPDGTYTEPPPLGFTIPRLTGREAVLADWLAQTLTLVEISDQLRVSINTVKSQTRSLYNKLGVTSRADAVRRLEGAGFFVNRPAPQAESR